MVNREYNVPDNPDRELLTHYLTGLAPYADSRKVYSHTPDSGTYWRAFDMVHVALHLSGVRVWSTESYTGGVSIGADRSRAERWVGYREPLTINALRCAQPFAEVSFMSGRLLVSLSDRLEAHIGPATHPNKELGELTATSMRMSDIDAASREILGELFQLPADYDTEFVYDLAENAFDTTEEWLQENEATLAERRAQLQMPASNPQWPNIKLTIPPYLSQ